MINKYEIPKGLKIKSLLVFNIPSKCRKIKGNVKINSNNIMNV